MGRRPKPDALKRAQGNPGKRPLVERPPPAAAGGTPLPLPFAKLTKNALTAYDLVGGELKRMNFVRPSDEPLVLRYCDTLAEYWRVTIELRRLGGPTYDCPTWDGKSTMSRVRPEFLVQERLSKRLESMEDRLGLSPMARQQYMLRMSQAGVQIPLLSKPDGAPDTDDDDADETAPSPRAPASPVGLLKHGLN